MPDQVRHDGKGGKDGFSLLSLPLESLTENLECGEWRERVSRVRFAHEKAKVKVESDVSQISARPIYSINHLRSALIVSHHPSL